MEKIIQHKIFNFRYFLASFLLVIFSLLMMVSCGARQVQQQQSPAPAKGVYHIVKKGETAFGIARAYSISLKELVEANKINDASNIKEGAALFIPRADRVIDNVVVPPRKPPAEVKREVVLKDKKPPLEKPASPETPGTKPSVVPSQSTTEESRQVLQQKPQATERREGVAAGKGRFLWPVSQGTVKTRFGMQPNKTFHNWIKIACKAGTNVRAAADGTVIFSSSLKDFGETIIIRHPNDFATVYTHLKKRYVKTDQYVKKGKTIALVGEIDEAGNAYINFEIRHKSKPQDPLLYLR